MYIDLDQVWTKSGPNLELGKNRLDQFWQPPNSSSGEAVSIGVYGQFFVHLIYAIDMSGLSVGSPVGTLAYFASLFFYMVGLCCHFWGDMTSQGVIDLYHFLFGSTNSCNIIAITPCSGI
jgi:hypothetical protein